MIGCDNSKQKKEAKKGRRKKKKKKLSLLSPLADPSEALRVRRGRHAPPPPLPGPEALGHQRLRHPQGVAAVAARRGALVVVVVVLAAAVAAPPAAARVNSRRESLPLVGEQGLGKGRRVSQALQHGVHEAGVSQVLEARALLFRDWWWRRKERERDGKKKKKKKRLSFFRFDPVSSLSLSPK